MIDLSTWLTKQEAADRIGVSTKAIERFTRAGKLEQRFRPQAGSPHVAVYFPDDVEKLAAGRRQEAAPFVLPPDADLPTNGNGHHSSTALAISPEPGIQNIPGEDLLRALVTAAVQMSQTSQTSVSQTSAYVAKADALALSGISDAELRSAVKAGEVKVRGRRYRVKDLEAL